jgi:hypothetical protein
LPTGYSNRTELWLVLPIVTATVGGEQPALASSHNPTLKFSQLAHLTSMKGVHLE